MTISEFLDFPEPNDYSFEDDYDYEREVKNSLENQIITKLNDKIVAYVKQNENLNKNMLEAYNQIQEKNITI